MSVLSAVKRANAKGRPEESVALRAAVLVSVLAASVAVLAQDVGDPALRFAATAGIAAGFVYSHVAREREGYVLKAFLAVGVVIAFSRFLSQISGFDPAELGSLQFPLAELFLWVQFLHSLDVPARRDLMFSLMSSLVLIAVAGVLSISTGLGLHLAVWFVAATVSLVLAHRSEMNDLPSITARRSGAPVSPRSLVRPVGAVVAVVLVLALIAFLVLPPAGSGRAVAFPTDLPNRIPVPNAGGLVNPSLASGTGPATGDPESVTGRQSFGYFGFAEQLDTSVRGRPDETLMMRVRADRPDFWRGQSFDVWDGRTWKVSDDEPEVVSGGSPLELDLPVEDTLLGFGGTEFVQTVYVEEPGPNLIFAAYAPERLYFQDRAVFQLSDGTVRTAVYLPPDSVYTVVSRRRPATEEQLRRADVAELLRRAAAPGVELRPEIQSMVARYTQLPDVPDRVVDLAASVTASVPTTYDKIRALEQWMGANTSYTLDIPPLPRGADAVEQYLFVDRQGFCEQIATSLVVMLRSLGIPARLGVGYTPGERNPFTGLWEVRARDAHAWAEVWFPGFGWQAFDPTASVPLSGDPFRARAGTGVFKWVTSRLPSVPREVVAGMLALAAGATFVRLISVASRRRRDIRRREAARTWADVTLGRLEDLGAANGRERAPSETAARYAASLARGPVPDERLHFVAALVEQEAFAGAPASSEERAEAERVLAEAESRR